MAKAKTALSLALAQMRPSTATALRRGDCVRVLRSLLPSSSNCHFHLVACCSEHSIEDARARASDKDAAAGIKKTFPNTRCGILTHTTSHVYILAWQ